MTLQAQLDALWDARAQFDATNPEHRRPVEQAIALLDNGEARVAEPTANGWQVHQWLKKAVLLSFRLADNAPVEMGALRGYDKVPLKFEGWAAAARARAWCRPPQCAAAASSPRTRC